MQLFFQNPFWLIGLLATVPILAHLFSRTRPRRYEFPSVRLLREAMRKVNRIRRPRDRWLLFLRTLAMLGIALAFLQPWLRSRSAGGNDAAKTMILVVDLSASMGYADGTRTRLAQASAAAEELLASLPPNSKANVIWIQAGATGVLPEPGPNLEFLRQALRQAVVPPEPGDIAGALTLALKQLGAADGERELAIISDFQKNAWREANLQVPPGIKLTRLAVGEEEGANVGLTGLATEPARPVAGQQTQLICRVRNFSGESRRITVYCEAGEKRFLQTVELTPWSESLAAMPVVFPVEGLIPLKATISEDRFSGDDVRYGLADVRGALQIGVFGSFESATARTWLRAARALDRVAVRSLSPEDLVQPERVDVLFAADWKGQSAEAISAHLHKGGALVLHPAPGIEPQALRMILGLGSPEAENANQPPGSQVQESPGWSLRIANEDHPVFALFANGTFGDPVKGKFRRRVATPDFLASKPLLTFEDGAPALTLHDVSLTADRHTVVAWWNLDLGATDWPSQSAFLPFFGEFLHYLAQRTVPQTVREYEPGENLRFEAGAAIDPADVRLADERDKEVKIAPESARLRQRLMTVNPVPPGSYRWIAQGNMLDRAVMNFPDGESDLRRLSLAELEEGNGMLISNAGRARLHELREGEPIWHWFLAAAALFLVLEGILAGFHRIPKETKEAPANV